MSNIIKLNVTVDHQRYYSAEGMWGVYGMIPNTQRDKIETLDRAGVFAVSGNTPRLTKGEKYDIEIAPSYTKKYGKGYEFVMVAAKRPKTIEEQKEYLKLMVTEKQYDGIIKVYPEHHILDLMENDEFDYNKVKGLGEKSYFKIKKYIFDNMEIQEALVELKDLGISFNAMKKLIEFFGSSQTLVQKVDSNIYELCKVSGFGFKKIDDYALNRGDDPTSNNRIIAAINYVLEMDADKGNSWINVREATKQLENLLEIDIRYIEDVLDSINEKDKTIYKEEGEIALRENYVYEANFKSTIEGLAKKPPSTKVDDIDDKIVKMEKKNGFEYTIEQKEAIHKAVNNNILVINGRAGTGKSTVLKGIVSILSDYSYMSVALSGKAAKVLKDNDLLSKTIHKMLMETIDFENKEVIPLRYDIIIIDEASMVNNYLFYRVTEALKDDAKLIIVGDNGQLPPIGTGANFDNLIKYGEGIPRQELTIVHRQAQKSGILSAANIIREGEQINSPYSEETEVYGELEDMVLIPTDKDTDIVGMVLDIAKRNTDKDLFEFQVITGRVDSGDLSVRNLNIEMQKIFNDVRKPAVPRSGYEYRVGDKVIQNGNNYEANVALRKNEFDDDLFEDVSVEVFNGTLGKIVDIKFDPDNTKKNHRVYIQFEGIEDIVEYSVHELDQIGLAYALTVHKCVTPDTYVITNKGLMKIKNAINREGVMIHNGKYLEEPYKHVEYKNEKTITIKTKRGFELEGTRDHRLHVFDNNGNLIIKEMSDIKKGDSIALVKNTGVFNDTYVDLRDFHNEREELDVRAKLHKKPNYLDEKLGLLMGMMVADGTITKDGKVFRYSKRYRECTEKFVKLTKEIFNYTKKIATRYRKNSGDYIFEGGATDIVLFLSKLGGMLPNEKYVSDLILQSPESVQQSFLKGLFEDGTVTIKQNKYKEKLFDYIELSLYGKELVKTVQLMLLNMGVMSSTTNKNKKGKNNYTLYIYKNDAKTFREKIGFISNFKRERLSLVNREVKQTSSKVTYPNINKNLYKLVERHGISLERWHLQTLRDEKKGASVTDVLLNRIVKELDLKQVGCPMSNYFRFLLSNVYADSVSVIEEGYSDTLSFVMKESESYIQNGMYGMNCQGSSADHLIFAFDGNSFMLLSREFIYTGITRAKKGCIMIAENRMLHMGIRKVAGGSRRTFLKELLLDEKL